MVPTNIKITERKNILIFQYLHLLNIMSFIQINMNLVSFLFLLFFRVSIRMKYKEITWHLL